MGRFPPGTEFPAVRYDAVTTMELLCSIKIGLKQIAVPQRMLHLQDEENNNLFHRSTRIQGACSGPVFLSHNADHTFLFEIRSSVACTRCREGWRLFHQQIETKI